MILRLFVADFVMLLEISHIRSALTLRLLKSDVVICHMCVNRVQFYICFYVGCAVKYT